MQAQLDSRFLALETFIKQCQGKDVSEQIQSQLCRFGAVLVCGNVERCVEVILLNRLNSRAHPRVLNFVKSHFQRGNNFDCAAIGQLLVRFDTDWYGHFVKFVETNPDVKEAIASCYAVRNSVSHGGTSSVGLKRLIELVALSRRLIDGVVQATS
ncbi:HEPN domain-containing protein [Devosia sp.]|uniref:HEPN domain-containing protein n=1 Tax=Devosia sp. TaxID=1871048 RepID=UPI00344D69E4